jgi:chemotaxis protein MotB
MMSMTSRAVGVLAMLLLFLPGCVTKGRYDMLASDRDSIAAERDSLAERSAKLQEQLEATRLEREEALASLAASEAAMNELQSTYGSLVTELQSELDSGQIKIQQLADGIKLNLSQEILFPSGSANLDVTGQDVIARVAGQIRDENAVISVEGHSDNVPIRGSLLQRYPTNWELAAARASSVVRLLTEQGVEPGTVRAVSRGPFAPVASNETSEGRAQNRRIEIILRPAGASAPAALAPSEPEAS